MSDETRYKPVTPAFPTAAQVQSFMARGVTLANVSTVPVARVPETVIYHEGPQPPAPLLDGVKRARTIEEGPEPEQPRPPSSPDEQELREVLEQCVMISRFAADNVTRAHATHERAVRHVEHCRERLAEFDGLDQQITDATVEALRSGDGRPRVDDADPLRRRVIERDLAKADLRAAEHALAVLFDALTDAQADAATATKAADRAAAELAMLLAGSMAERVFELEAEAKRLREELYGADVVGVTPAKALKAIYGDGSRFLRPVDKSRWTALRARLLADPAAPLTLEID